MQAAILAAPRVQATINLTAGEQNDTIATAVIGTLTGDSAVITVNGNIGDNVALSDPTADVDMVRVDLSRGTTVVANVNALTIGSPLDSYLRVFDSKGNELAANDNRFGSTDSRITFMLQLTDPTTSQSAVQAIPITRLRSSTQVLGQVPATMS